MKWLNNLKKLKIIGLFIIIVITTLIYSNHFKNPFFFDDSHTIVTNSAITDLTNWTTFFTDATTFSSLPANRAYRPMITLMNAIDYFMAGKLDASYFHYHIFFWFLVTIVLFFILSKKLYQISIESKTSPVIVLVSLLATLFFATHTINAETINYICARSDSFSTLCIMASLLLFIYKKTRKYHLYLFTMLIGIWTKQTAVMFIPILFCYLLLFEDSSHYSRVKKEFKSWFFSVLKVMILPTIIAFGIFIINQIYLTPESTVSSNTQVSRLDYILTQFYVIIHYVGNFLLPTSLSADPDIAIIKPWYDKRILLGMVFTITLIFIAIKSAYKAHTRPISFGILWFFIGLLPTTLVPLYQIANDHRMFLPFVGIFIAASWGVYLFINSRKSINLKYTSLVLCFILIGAYANGTYQRNKVWKDAETLWKDVTVKSPNNGRGQMNYGLALMAKGDYQNAETYFLLAEKKSPNWYAVKINLAILNGAINKKEKAKQFFQEAISLNSTAPDPEYFYARYLFQNGEIQQAKKMVAIALTKSPNHLKSNELSKKIAEISSPIENQIEILLEKLHNNQENTNLMIDLSNKLYSIKEYDKAINYCQEVIKLDSSNKFAYNNMCSCYNQKKQWKLAKSACEKALLIDPNFQIAKNNLSWALGGLNNNVK